MAIDVPRIDMLWNSSRLRQLPEDIRDFAPFVTLQMARRYGREADLRALADIASVYAKPYKGGSIPATQSMLDLSSSPQWLQRAARVVGLEGALLPAPIARRIEELGVAKKRTLFDSVAKR